MIYQGNAISVARDDEGIATLTFDLKDESVNKLSSAVVQELEQALEALRGESDIAGLVLASAKDAFIVGADITEFHGLFAKGEDEIQSMLEQVHGIFNGLEDLPFPTVSAINGLALGAAAR
ncbi:fatty acid oxidation complex subunit alpha [Halomonas elongata]|uniref:Fatty acid oxidation complex subunit alpha n=1 Tax=Halomonas elongata TaxID=2746 RepID=A0A1B8P5L0_HALEL|nr:fatty acid oxidation complex subunit alpha [Halomonas elongata]